MKLQGSSSINRGDERSCAHLDLATFGSRRARGTRSNDCSPALLVQATPGSSRASVTRSNGILLAPVTAKVMEDFLPDRFLTRLQT